MNSVALFVVAYVIGSIPFAVIVSKAMGLSDPRTYGSKNPGATNVLRSGSKLAALLTLAGDALKGFVVVIAAKALAQRFGFSAGDVALAGLIAFLGHVFPLFIGFKGGKGVATAGGVLFALDWQLGLVAVVTWLAMAVVFRYSSLASITAGLVAAAASFYLFGAGAGALCVLVMAIIMLWRHAPNIRNLATGKESKIGAKKAQRST